MKIRYVIVDIYTSCNIFLACSSLNALGMIVLTLHLTKKFLSNVETIVTMHTDQRTARECYMANLRL